MADQAELTERLTDLEVRVAYQDRVVTALDDVVRQLSAKIEHLERELSELRAGAKSPPPALGPASEPPPHY
jgi:SlyX protein